MGPAGAVATGGAQCKMKEPSIRQPGEDTKREVPSGALCLGNQALHHCRVHMGG